MQKLNWQGFQIRDYFVMLLIVIISSYMGIAPKGFLGSVVYCVLVGVLLYNIGEGIPFIRNFFGGGSIVILFGCAALVYFNLLPEKTMEAMKDLSGTMDMLGFFCMSLIMGSILTMDRKVLIKSGPLFAVPILGCLLVSGIITYIFGKITGFGGTEALFMIGLPVFGAGAASGAVPISQIYESITGTEASVFMTQLMPAIALANAVAIVVASLLDSLGRKCPSLTGQGKMTKGAAETQTVKETEADFGKIGSGMILTGVFMTAGIILSKFIPIHYYATTIILCALAKIFNILPDYLMDDCSQWYRFTSKTFAPVVLAVTGFTAIDIGQMLGSMSVVYLLLIVVCVVGCAVGAGLFGKLVGFYPIEAAITGGLCMANMGGSGDVATLGAAKRMNIMPYAQISSRLGGALVIILCNILAGIFSSAGLF